MAGLGLGGGGSAASRGQSPRPTGITLRDANNRPISPGLGMPGTTKKWPALVGNIPDTRDPSDPTGGSVGIPTGSSLVINTAGGTITTKAFSPANTYSELDKIMSGSVNAGGRMGSPRANLASMQRFLMKYGYLSDSDFDSMADWGNPSHKATKEAIASLMYMGNLTGESWTDVLLGKGMSRRQQQALSDYSGSGSGSGSGAGGVMQYVTRQTDLSNRKDARALLRTTMQSILGRDPEPQEVKNFLAALNDEERDEPTVQTRTVSASGSSQADDIVNESGVNRDEFALDYVQNEFGREASTFEGDNYEMMILNAIGGLS